MRKRAKQKQTSLIRTSTRKPSPPRIQAKRAAIARLSKSAARESHQWYRLIVDNVKDFAIFSADVNGNISSWNPGAERFFGYTASEILGKPMEILYSPEDRAAGVAERERKLAVKEGSSEDERWHLRKDGSRFFVFGRVNPMYSDEGELCGFIKIARDITTRAELQNRLQSSEEFHRLILENIQDFAIFTIDTAAKIESWNAGAEQTYGYKREEIIGQDLSVLYTPAEQARGEPAHILASTIQHGYWVEEDWCVRKDGSRIFVTGVLRPIRDQTGSVRGFSKVARDITARHRLQEELERTRGELEKSVAERTASLTEVVHELETFSYSLSHDMRAPLRAIEGFAEVLRSQYAQNLTAEGKELLQRIASAAERLDYFIKESLSFHRGPREPLPLKPTELDPLLDALSAESPELAAIGALSVQRPLLTVMAHPPSLMQALRNLLSNALRFMSPGQKPQIRVWTERKNGRVRINVKDNGIGIAPADLEKVWNLFTRLHPEHFPGTGVGLALVRKAVERMGGSTGVESHEGQGSLFWLELQAGS